MFNLDWKFNLRLVAWKFQSRSEILNFFNLWALWVNIANNQVSNNQVWELPLGRRMMKIVAKSPQIMTQNISAVPMRRRSKRGRTQKHVSAKERKKSPQKSAKERFRVKIANSKVWNLDGIRNLTCTISGVLKRLPCSLIFHSLVFSWKPRKTWAESPRYQEWWVTLPPAQDACRDAASTSWEEIHAENSRLWCRILRFSCHLSAAFYAAYGFTGAFGRNLCKFTFPQRRRNLRKSLPDHKTYTGVKRAKKWLR